MSGLKQHLMGLISQYRGLRKEIYVLFIGRIVTNMGSMVMPMLTLILSQKLGLSAEDVALLIVAAGLLMLPANLIGGKLADHCNKKAIIVWCDRVSVVCYILCGILPLGAATVGLMIVAGIGQSMEHPAYNALFADLTATKDRQRAFSLNYLGMNLGLVLSPTIAGLLFKDYLWLSFIISGAAIAISTLLIVLFVKNIEKEPDDSEEAVYQRERGGEGILRILKDNRILILYVLIAAIYGAVYSQYSYLLPLDMGKVHGENGALIFGTVSSLNCIAVVVFTPVFTRIFHKAADLRKLIMGQCFVGIGYTLFLTLIGHVPVYYVAMLLFTWGEIFATLADGPYLTARIPASHRGRITGLITVLSSIIAGIIELSVGKLYDNIGSYAAWLLVLGLLGGAIILTFILLIRDKKQYPILYNKKGTAPAVEAEEAAVEGTNDD